MDISQELSKRIGLGVDGTVERRFVSEIRVKEGVKGVIHAALSSLAVDAYRTITWWSPVKWKDEDYGLSFYLGDDEAPFLFEHGYTMKRERNPLGVIRNFKVEGDGRSAETLLECDFVFAMEDPADSFPKSVFYQYEKGYRKGFSQGFQPTRILEEEESNEFLEEQGRPERGVIILLGETLLEGSAVLFPANKDAKIKADQEVLELAERAMHQIGGATHEDINKLETKIKELEERLTPQSLAKVLAGSKRLRFLD